MSQTPAGFPVASSPALHLTDKQAEKQNASRRNEGTISAILSALETQLRDSLERGLHGEISLNVRLVGHDVTEFNLGTTTRTKTR